MRGPLLQVSAHALSIARHLKHEQHRPGPVQWSGLQNRRSGMLRCPTQLVLIALSQDSSLMPEEAA
jgi:hypothetical protein